jgi:hypothetical protein
MPTIIRMSPIYLNDLPKVESAQAAPRFVRGPVVQRFITSSSHYLPEHLEFRRSSNIG